LEIIKETNNLERWRSEQARKVFGVNKMKAILSDVRRSGGIQCFGSQTLNTRRGFKYRPRRKRDLGRPQMRRSETIYITSKQVSTG
jgi:hypothetical protein